MLKEDYFIYLINIKIYKFSLRITSSQQFFQFSNVAGAERVLDPSCDTIMTPNHRLTDGPTHRQTV